MVKFARGALVISFALFCHMSSLLVARGAEPDFLWRRVDTPSLEGGAPLPALMRVGDIDRSDAGFVGMMVQCRDKALQTVLIVAMPVPPKQSVQVSLAAAGAKTEVLGTPIVTGAGITVPINIASWLSEPWRGEPDLDIIIKTRSPLHGTVPLVGLSSLISSFASDCQSGAVEIGKTKTPIP